MQQKALVTSEREPDFVRTLGLPFMAHLLRRISDRMVADAGAFEAGLGIKAPPRTASTMLLLRSCGPQSVTGIAAQLRQSHPLVITWVNSCGRLVSQATLRIPAIVAAPSSH